MVPDEIILHGRDDDREQRTRERMRSGRVEKDVAPRCPPSPVGCGC